MTSSLSSLLPVERIALKPSIAPVSRIRSVPMTHFRTQSRTRRLGISCEVAVKPDPKVSPLPATTDGFPPAYSSLGARVRVTAALKVYHVPRVAEVDLTGMEGQVKQYVGVFKGTEISPSLPFKVEFVKEVEGRGRVKFLAHLREDEFEYI